MIKKNFLLLAVLLVSVAFAGVMYAQPKRKPQAKPAVAPKMTATGLLYYVGDGQAILTCLLKTPEGIIEINVVRKTRFINFPAGDRAWDLGAEWRVTYHKSKDAALAFEADTVTYTGNTNSTIADALAVARSFLMALDAENKDYKKAYSYLSAEAQRKLTFTDFKKIYQPVEFTIETWVCSHSEEKVVLMLSGFFDLYQRIEVAPTNSGASTKQFRINRLFDFEKDIDKAEAACLKTIKIRIRLFD